MEQQPQLVLMEGVSYFTMRSAETSPVGYGSPADTGIKDHHQLKINIEAKKEEMDCKGN